MNGSIFLKRSVCAAFVLASTLLLPGQELPAPTSTPAPQEEDTIELSPFTVSSTEDDGYAAQHTLAGTRIRTDIKDVGSSITVITSKFLKDTNTTNLTELLVYTPNAEVAGPGGNFLGNGDSETAGAVRYGQTRIRGLVSADNLRGFFPTEIPFDSYNTGRIDIQRGANSILFGIGSPAGIINSSINQASFTNSYNVENQVGSFGSLRFSGDFNQELIDDTLAVRISLLHNETKYRQKPAFRDDKRFYGAMRWDPGFLNRSGMTTTFEASFEHGNIESNLQRQAPPGDYLTPWFTQLRDHQTTGFTWRKAQSTALLPGFEFIGPNAGDLITQGGTISTFMQGMQDGAFRENFGGQNVTVGDAFYVGIEGYARVAATDYQLPGGTIGAFRNKVLTDPTIFDYYNVLLDGNTKREFNDFDAIDIAVRQTFGDDLFGYELAYDEQKIHSGGRQFLGDTNYGIVVDVMATLPGGVVGGAPDPAGGVYVDRPDPVNPHLGQAYVIGGGRRGSGFNWKDGKRTTMRGTAYLNLDFQRMFGRESTLGRIFGENTFTVLGNRYRDYSLTASGADYYASDDFVGTSTSSEMRGIYVVNYLSPLKLSGSSPSGLNLPGLDELPVPGSNVPILLFDNVASNPTRPYREARFGTIINSLLPERQRTYGSGSKTRGTIDSFAGVWQGRWFDGLVIPLVGIRRDSSYNQNAGTPPSVRIGGGMDVRNVYSDEWNLGDPGPEQKVTSKTYSLVTHLPRTWRDKLPGDMDLQLIFNKSENFDPRPGRVDVLNRPLPNPSGDTKEYGVAVTALNNKLYLKIAHYETRVKNADISSHANLNALAVAETWARASALSHLGYLGPLGDGSVWRAAVNYGTTSPELGSHIVTYKPHGPLVGQAWAGLTPNEPFPPGTVRTAYTQEELDEQYNIMLAAANAYLDNPPPDAFLDAMGIDKEQFHGRVEEEPSVNRVANSVITGTTISKGYEVELVANPIRGLDILLNVTKTDARRTEMAQSYLDYVNARQDVFLGPAGDLRLWSNGEDDAHNDPYTTQGNGTARIWFVGSVLAPIQKFLALENSSVPELKPWSFNVVTNYAFQEGSLKNANVGVAYRWLDKNVTGFPVVVDSETGLESLDVDNPYYGSTQGTFDFWIGYQRKLRDKYTWRVQLNVRNVFANDELMRVNVQPDGSAGAYRIPEPRTFTLTNSISF